MSNWFAGRTAGRSFPKWPKTNFKERGPRERGPRRKKKRTGRKNKSKASRKYVIPIGTPVRIQKAGHYIWDDHVTRKQLILKPLRYTKPTKRFTFMYRDYYITVDEWRVEESQPQRT